MKSTLVFQLVSEAFIIIFFYVILFNFFFLYFTFLEYCAVTLVNTKAAFFFRNRQAKHLILSSFSKTIILFYAKSW